MEIVSYINYDQSERLKRMASLFKDNFGQSPEIFVSIPGEMRKKVFS